MLAEAAAAAGISLHEITRTCFGLAASPFPPSVPGPPPPLPLKSPARSSSAATKKSPSTPPSREAPASSSSLAPAPTPSAAPPRAPSTTPAAGDPSSATKAPATGSASNPSAPPSTPTTRSHLRNRGAPSMTVSPSWVGSTQTESTPSASLLLEIQRHWNLNSLAELIELGNHRGDASRPAPTSPPSPRSSPAPPSRETPWLPTSSAELAKH